MIRLLYIIIFFFSIGCSSNKIVYWCGDHPCINKKEKESYFKKTMIVEVKELKKGNKNNDSDIEKIMRQAHLDEKKRIKDEKDLAKQTKLDEKRRIKEEKWLVKQAKLDEKRRIKEEKRLAKQAKLDEKSRNKEEKNLENRIKKDEKTLIKKQKNKQNPKIKLSTKISTTEIDSKQFNDLVEKIIKKNSFRSYPDINDIPN